MKPHFLLLTLFLITSCIPVQITPEEKALLLTEADFVDYLAFQNSSASGKFSKTLYQHRSKEIEYDVELDNPPFFLSHTIAFDSIATDAVQDYGLSISAYKAGLAIPDVDVVELAGERLGDQSFAGILQKDGMPFGNMLVVRRNNTVHGLLFVGIYFDDPEVLREFIWPTLVRADAYNQDLLSELVNKTR